MEKIEKSACNRLITLSNMIWSISCQAGDLLKEMSSIINYSQAILGKLLSEAVELLGLHQLDALQTDELTHFLQVYFITFSLVAN